MVEIIIRDGSNSVLYTTENDSLVRSVEEVIQSFEEEGDVNVTYGKDVRMI